MLERKPQAGPVLLRHVAKTAATVSIYSRSLVDEEPQARTPDLTAFWHASRELQRHWQAGLAAPSVSERPEAIEPLLPDIFVAELLIRTWLAVVVCTGGENETAGREAIARNILRRQIHIRNVSMALMAGHAEKADGRIARLDRLRRRTERWTDLLLAPFLDHPVAAEFAVDPERASEFRRDQADSEPHESFQWLLRAGLQQAFASMSELSAPASPLCSRLLESVVASLPAEIRDRLFHASSGPASDGARAVRGAAAPLEEPFTIVRLPQERLHMAALRGGRRLAGP